MTPTFYQGLMLSLSSEQKTQIRTTDKSYVNFSILVFNAGHVVQIELSDTLKEIPEEEWNGYDVSLDTRDVVELLDRMNL